MADDKGKKKEEEEVRSRSLITYEKNNIESQIPEGLPKLTPEEYARDPKDAERKQTQNFSHVKNKEVRSELVKKEKRKDKKEKKKETKEEGG
uniref:Uncharacterized protein n=1 Tax=Paramoeba aestuarina TaxID=180227 RepID=A0A7S4KB01_9EUKA